MPVLFYLKIGLLGVWAFFFRLACDAGTKGSGQASSSRLVVACWLRLCNSVSLSHGKPEETGHRKPKKFIDNAITLIAYPASPFTVFHPHSVVTI